MPTPTRLLWLSEHIHRHHHDDLEAFANEQDLSIPHLNQLLSDFAMWDGERIYLRRTNLMPKLVLPKRSAVQTLQEHIASRHDGDWIAFSKKNHLDESEVKRMLLNHSLYAGGEVLEPVPMLRRHTAISLKEHIAQRHQGNNSSFAREHDTTQQQVARWLKKECFWIEGEVYLRRTQINPVWRMTPRTVAYKLDKYIDHQFSGKKHAFMEHTGLTYQQLSRYLTYDAYWLLGEVYKRQTRFCERTHNNVHAYDHNMSTDIKTINH